MFPFFLINFIMKFKSFLIFIIFFSTPCWSVTTISGGKISTSDNSNAEKNIENKLNSPLEISKIEFQEKLSDKEVLTSYQLAKENEIATVWYPKGFWLLDIGDHDLSTWIDVDGDGEKEIFTGVLKHSINSHTAKNAPNSDFQFLKRNKRGKHSNGKIYDSVQLSIAIRYFAGANPYNLMTSHGVGYSDIYAINDTIINQTGRAVECFIILLLNFLILNLLITQMMGNINKFIMRSRI